MLDIYRDNPSLEQIAAKPKTKDPVVRHGESRRYIAIMAASGLSLVLAAGCASQDSKPTLTPKLLPTIETPFGDSVEDQAKYDQTTSILKRVLNPDIAKGHRIARASDVITQPQSKAYNLKVGKQPVSILELEPIKITTQADYRPDGIIRGFTADIWLNQGGMYTEFPGLAKFFETSSLVSWAKMPAERAPEFASALLNLPKDTVWITRQDLMMEGLVEVFGRGELADDKPYLVWVNINNRHIGYREGDAVKEFDDSRKQGDIIILAEKYLGIRSQRFSDTYSYKGFWKTKLVTDQNGETVWSMFNPNAIEGGITAKVQYGPNGELLSAGFKGSWVTVESLVRDRSRANKELTLQEVAKVIFGASVENTRFQEESNKLKGAIIKFGKTEADDRVSMRFVIDDDGFRAEILDLNIEGRLDKKEKPVAVNPSQLFAPHKFTASGYLKPRFAPRKLSI